MADKTNLTMLPPLKANTSEAKKVQPPESVSMTFKPQQMIKASIDGSSSKITLTKTVDKKK
ncbi:hypothetical protein F2Q68_00033639 [Brassica cretica]|uniref:Uncharacterized protein n=2 Tax=Brassica cretica TaxID=69181 RepID=A0ABQ7EM38_BRACR|nr:hypothetical protein F2Q68_00033639 [Brassica cretica]KAF3597623.1 hypothetical protein DY000_02020661 [Brassica cretica]